MLYNHPINKIWDKNLSNKSKKHKKTRFELKNCNKIMKNYHCKPEWEKKLVRNNWNVKLDQKFSSKYVRKW